MAAKEMSDDREYRKWAALHPDGFVLNFDGDLTRGKAVLHLGRCDHIADHKTGKLAGGSTRKFVAETKAELRELAQTLGRSAGSRWNNCQSCGA